MRINHYLFKRFVILLCHYSSNLEQLIKRILNLLMGALLLTSVQVIAEQELETATAKIEIGRFSQGDLNGWEEKQFSGKTHYQIVVHSGPSQGQETPNKSLKASANNSASGLFKTQRIDLQQTPYLHWSWKTDHLYSGLNEVSKAGDDFVARIYIVIDGGLFIWKTKALNYVWSSSFKENVFWPNPYTANATMLAVESGQNNIGKWVNYKRHVGDDLKATLGKEVRYIDAIAVMTDSDSSGQKATTYYGDIYFTAQ